MFRKNRKLVFFIVLLAIILIILEYNGHISKEQIRGVLNTVNQLSKEDNGNSPTSLTLDATSYTLKKGGGIRPFVTANYSAGHEINISEQSSYSTSNKKVATVDRTGLITAVGSGFATITVSYEGISKSIPIAVDWASIQVNVKDYGAYGDGKRDDTNAFQKAIDDVAKKGGGEIFIPKGKYILHPIFLKSKVNLVGESRDEVFIKLSNQAPDDYTRIINVENVNNLKIQNITFDGNFKNHPNGIEHMHCIFVWDSQNILIDNNRLINAVGDGISISGSTKTSEYIIISNNILEDNRRSNIVLEQVNHLQIFNNISTSKVGRPALHFEPWEKISFYNAEIWNNNFTSNTTGYCVQLEGGQDKGNFFHNVKFSKNTVNCPTGQFLVMETKNAKIHHNSLNVSMILVWIKNEDLQIYKNNIHSKNGIRIEGTWGILSKGTHIFKNNITTEGYGVHISLGAKDTRITQNMFSGTGGLGVYFSTSETDIINTTITNNTFKNFEYGIITESYDNQWIDGLEVSGNKFANLTEYALFLKGTSRNINMNRNVVKNASGAYINANGGLMENVVIKDNRISGGKRGIFQTQYGNGSLYGLIISGNDITHSADSGDQYLTGAAIELDRNAVPPTDVSIIDNTLTNNAKNFITVPDALLKSVKNNNY